MAGIAPYAFSYAYNRADGLTQMTYPSGRVVNYGFDAAGRVASVTGSGTPAAYVSGIQYWPHGAVKAWAYGNAKSEEHCYNGRLQMTAMRVGSGVSAANDCAAAGGDLLRLGLGYTQTGTGNNGNIRQQEMTRQGFYARQVYSYADGRGRLTGVDEFDAAVGGVKRWSESYGFDDFGNQWVSAGAGLSPLTPTAEGQINKAKNRLTYNVYDAAGNVTGNALLWNGFNYDAENRVITSAVKETETGPVTSAVYEYDADGQRVKSTVGTGAAAVVTVFVHDAGGQVAAEYRVAAPSGTPLPAGGRRYVVTDWLGSSRLWMDGAGADSQCADYKPFGGALTVGRTAGCFGEVAPGERVKFTGKERDAETGLDYFGARYLSAAQGRFTGPDIPLYAQHPAEPQSWNLYSYTANNPLGRIDPDGRNWFSVNGNWEWHDGDTYDPDGPKGKQKALKSAYTHLVVFEKTGGTLAGGASGTLTLYGAGYGNVLATSTAFSGGIGYAGTNFYKPPAADGTYTIDINLSTAGPGDVARQRAAGLWPKAGIQDLSRLPSDIQGTWGTKRARLQPPDGTTNEAALGIYIHGMTDRAHPDSTWGCICERSQNILSKLSLLAQSGVLRQGSQVPAVVRSPRPRGR